MKNLPFVLRIYGERQAEQWSLICLEFNLAAQADSLPEARQKLHSMIVGYLKDAIAGSDRDCAKRFLTRRAPWVFWAKYYIVKIRNGMSGRNGSRRLASSEAIPMVPAGA